MLVVNRIQLQFDFEFDSSVQDEDPIFNQTIPVWTDDDIHELHYKIMMRKLCEVCDGRLSPRVRREIIDWVMCDEIAPFSFACCCILEGADPLEFRENLLYYIDRQEAAAH